MGRMVLLLLGVMPLVASAEWAKTAVEDEMRSSSTLMYSQEVEPIRGQGPKLALRVFDKDDGAPTAMLSVGSGRVDGCPEPDLHSCDLQMRFDEGEVKEISFASQDGKNLIPTRVGAFAGAILSSKIFYIEIPVNGSTAQYRYELAGINVKYAPGPNISVMGFELGSAYPGRKPNLEVSRSEGEHICYSGDNVKNAFAGATASKATLCFYKDVFYRALIVPGVKASYKAGYKYLVDRFGKPDPDGIYPSWPNDSDKLIQRSVREAAYFAVEKNRYDYPFIITDEAWDLVIPKLL